MQKEKKLNTQEAEILVQDKEVFRGSLDGLYEVDMKWTNKISWHITCSLSNIWFSSSVTPGVIYCPLCDNVNTYELFSPCNPKKNKEA